MYGVVWSTGSTGRTMMHFIVTAQHRRLSCIRSTEDSVFRDTHITRDWRTGRMNEPHTGRMCMRPATLHQETKFVLCVTMSLSWLSAGAQLGRPEYYRHEKGSQSTTVKCRLFTVSQRYMENRNRDPLIAYTCIHRIHDPPLCRTF